MVVERKARVSISQAAGSSISILLILSCISCSKESSTTSKERAIRGQVVGDDGPLENATVRIKGTSNSTTSDSNGRFLLRHESDTAGKNITVTAAKQGHFIGSSSTKANEVTIALHSLPAADNEQYEWVDPTPSETESDNCGNCHRDIYDEWKSGAHANSASGRRFLNLYDGSDWAGKDDVGWNLLKDHPDGAGVCSSCHAPASSLDQLAIGDIRDISSIAKEGVHCDFCHKVQDVHLENVGLTHGRFGLKLLRPDHGQLFFGPLDDVDRGEDVHSSLITKSEFCASCHEGIVFGVPVYTTYSEWLQSPARKEGKQCQSCHMRPTGHMTNIAPDVGGIERDPMTLASHQLFPGGKEAMLKRSVVVDVNVLEESDNSTLRVSVTAKGVGHRVPTGFVDRHLVLVVQAFDQADRQIALQGPRLGSEVGSLAGEPGVIFGRKLTGADGESPIPFWQPVIDQLDTRLHPEETRLIDFGLPTQAFQVRIRLVYRRFWELVAKEKGWPANQFMVYDQRHRVAQ